MLCEGHDLVPVDEGENGHYYTVCQHKVTWRPTVDDPSEPGTIPTLQGIRCQRMYNSGISEWLADWLHGGFTPCWRAIFTTGTYFFNLFGPTHLMHVTNSKQGRIQGYFSGGGAGSPKRQVPRNFQTDKQKQNFRMFARLCLRQHKLFTFILHHASREVRCIWNFDKGLCGLHKLFETFGGSPSAHSVNPYFQRM